MKASDAGLTALEEARAEVEAPAQITPGADFSAEERSSLAWETANRKMAQGEELKATLIWAIRNGANLPDDFESRNWIADALEGKHEPKRGKGRPRKQPRPSLTQRIVERGFAETYQKWLEAFQRDRELAWFRFEALRLIGQKKPDAALWRRVNDLGTEDGRRSYIAAVSALGALPCPPATRGGETPHDLALKATARERRETPSNVKRFVTRANKSK